MADDKSSKSSEGTFGGLDPIVWVVGILLAVTLISNLFDEKIKQEADPSSNQNNNSTPKQDYSCGLNIISPKNLQMVGGEVNVSGSVGSCQWIPKGSIALYVQIVDSSGKLVSNYTTVYSGNKIDGAGSTPFGVVEFNANVPLISVPLTKTGFVIFINPDTSGNLTKTVKVPVQFKK